MISSNQYLFFTSVIYFFVGMFNLFVYKFAEIEVIQMVWLLVLCLPIFIPMAGIVRGAPLWRIK